ncbi:MAG: hypothetical protein WCR52_22000 [Bacteroidota bacterium]
MGKTEEKEGLKDILKKYILEVVTIFLGISISFLFDEWRENRKDEEIARKNLIFLKSNLVQDTLVLTGMIDIGKAAVYSINKLIYFKQDSEISDSINAHIDKAAGYLDFKSNQMAYEEIKQTGHTSLIKNDTLKRSFLSYYTLVNPYCVEWCGVDKMQTMTQLIPEMSIYFPVVIDTSNVVSVQEKIKSLKIRKIRNLLIMDASYKQEVIKAFIFTKEVAKKLLKRIDDELK